MHTRHNLQLPFILLAGLAFAFLALAPTSALAQEKSQKRTAETVERAPERADEPRRVDNTSTQSATTFSAHTPATTIENSNGDTILQTSEGGSFLAPDLGGAIPAEGAGGRMMWFADAKAFRAGEVGVVGDGKSWNADSVGTASVAMGQDTKAKALTSTAFGFNTTASATDATAMGAGTTASGVESVAMGENTTASANQAVAMGLDTDANGPNAFAAGTLSKARGENSAAMGFDTLVDGDHGTAFGRCNSGVQTGDLLEVGNGSLNSDGDACDTFSEALELEANGDMTIAGTLTEDSDRRLKTDIEPLGEETLSALQEIDPVRFRFEDERTHPDGAQIGLIAQEVQSAFPELVSEGDDGMLSLSYTKFSAVLLKGLQEQQTTIDQQEERIATLEAENEKIKERLAALERQTSSALPAGLTGPWALTLLLGLGTLSAGLLWRRRA